jgi:FKBP-type peptidyl-prolyl cis-trans isomerase SlyD
MIIEKDKVVSVTYELKLANGSDEIVEKVNNNNPLQFLLGHGNLLPKFESHLTGLKVGEKFDFVLNCQEAYGALSNEAIVEVPKSVFANDGQIDEGLLSLGNIIPMMDNQGNRFNGKVKELNGDTVKMDFNHPLAGEDLHFKGEVVDVREATEEELTHGHIHQASGCGGGCDCNSSSCGDGCSDGCGDGCCN